jgi:membrane fusion protein, multidrug efflux system
MKRFLILVVILAIGAAAAWVGVRYLHPTQESKQTAAPAAPPAETTEVDTEVVRSFPWKPYLETIGSVVPVNGATLTTELAGTVTEIAFESGTLVNAGDLLVQLDISEERAQLAAAEARRDWTKVTLERHRGLWNNRTVPKSLYDSAEADFRTAEGAVAEAQALIAKKTIRAPFRGVAGIRQVNLGQYINSGDAIVPLQTYDPIYVNLSIPQQDLGKVAVGQRVEIALDSYRNEAFEGKVTAIDTRIDPGSRYVEVQATFANPEAKLRPGMFAQVKLFTGDERDVIAIPISAVNYAPYGDSVFVVTELTAPNGGKYKGVQQQFVRLGQSRGDKVAVSTGVKPGDEVVTSEVFRLRSGGAIKVKSQTAGTPESSQTSG